MSKFAAIEIHMKAKSTSVGGAWEPALWREEWGVPFIDRLLWSPIVSLPNDKDMPIIAVNRAFSPSFHRTHTVLFRLPFSI